MPEPQAEKEFYQRFLNKYVKIIKLVQRKTYFYRGFVKAVFDDKLIIDDIKLGQVPISFNELTITGVKDYDDSKERGRNDK